MLKEISPLLIGFLVSVTMMIALRPVAVELRLVDVPGGRKVHNGEVPVIGGVAIFLGMIASCLVTNAAWPGEAALLVSAAVMVVVGALDDRFDLPPYTRILAHLAAVTTLVLATGYVVAGLGNVFGLGDINLGALSYIFTVVAAIALINGFNMLDGLDGLAGGVSAVALAGFSFVFWGQSGSGSAAAALGLLGAVSAFLIFNIPARFNRSLLAFMGDAGSTLLGFALAALALIAIQPQVDRLPPVIVLWFLPLPILELFTSTFRRVLTGLPLMHADRGHFHHVLLDSGFSVRAIFILYLMISAASTAIGLWGWTAGISEPVLFYWFLGMSLVWLLAIRKARVLASYLPESLKRGQLTSIKWRRFRSARN